MVTEKCENCGRAVGSLEQPFVWNDHPVCAACHRLLSTESKPTAMPAKRTALLLGVIGGGVLIIAAIVVGWIHIGRRSSDPPVGAVTPSAQDSKKQPVDLMPMIDPSRDAVAGVWMMKDGVLRSSGDHWSRLEIRYDLPPEYDFEIEFARKSGGDSVVQLASQQGRPFGFSMGYWNDSALAIESTGENIPPAVRGSGWIGDNVRHKATLKVRRDLIEAWLDGRAIVNWKTGSTSHDIQDGWKLNDPKRLGIGGFSPAEFYRISMVAH